MQLIRQITDHISFKGDAQMTVEAIQDLVEMELMKSSRKDVAQKYIAYRNQRSIARKAKTRDMFLEIINIKSNDITRENANMNADTPAGMMMKFASETTKPFVDDYLLSEEVLDAVSQNYLHIHDKDYYPTRWTASLHTASLPDTESRALRNALRPPAYWAASHWKPPKTKCTADRRFPRSTSTSLPTCATASSRK